MKIVVVGTGPAALKAMEAIAAHKTVSTEDGISITLVSAELTAPYSPMFLVSYLTGELTAEEILLEENHGLPVERLLGRMVIGVEDDSNKVVLENGDKIGYDKLLIGTGASPLKPRLRGIDKEGVYFLNRLEDAEKLSRQIPNVNNILIIGAGTTGIEAALAFNRMRKNVLLVEQANQILPQMLDSELAEYLQKRLVESGLKLLLGRRVSEILGDDRATRIVVGDEEIEGDLILVTVGVRPNVHFLESSRVKINQGILVDEKMQTNVPNIFAAGDVAESINPYGEHELVFSWYNAIEQGWVAGCNMVGVQRTSAACLPLMVLKGTNMLVVAMGRKREVNAYETLSHTDEETGVFEKIFVKDGHIDCYQAIGIVDRVGLMYGYIKERKGVGNIKDMLFNIQCPVHLMA